MYGWDITRNIIIHICVGFPRNFQSIVVKDQRLFTFFVHCFNHIKSFWTKVERCCATLLLCKETLFMYNHNYHQYYSCEYARALVKPGNTPNTVSQWSLHSQMLTDPTLCAFVLVYCLSLRLSGQSRCQVNELHCTINFGNGDDNSGSSGDVGGRWVIEW